ncbi:MAG: DNA polymerase III subunit beta [Muribaculaceae bacterium]|nr:DNA polymerase III subunit beta [Muribaculaceae bacterium]
MKFNVPGKAFYQQLTAVSKVLNAKNALSILDNFLLSVEGNTLTITGSDAENVMSASLEVMDSDADGRVALPAKRLLEVVKEISNQPLTLTVDEKSFKVDINYLSGEFTFMGVDPAEFPVTPPQAADTTLNVPAAVVTAGLENTLFAVSTEQIRPIMTGICWDVHPEDITFVSSDTHKLVRYVNSTFKPGSEVKFILPSKPAAILKGLIDKEEGDISVRMDSKSAEFAFGPYTLNCRFIKGNYPNYNRVIPQDNPFTVTVDRQGLLSAVRRVSLFASKASSLVRFNIGDEGIGLASQDLDYSTQASERVMCGYEGNPMTIGFNAQYMMEVLGNLKGDTIIIRLSDPARPGLFVPAEQNEGEDVVMLQMPMQVIE